MSELSGTALTTEESDDSQILMKVLHHPRRRSILRILLDSGEPRSPVEMAEELDEPLSNVSYHVRVLESKEAVRLVGTEPVLGSIKHFYVPGRLVQRHRKLVEHILATGE